MYHNYTVEFATCDSVQDVKNLMREFAKQLHPDLNPGISDDFFKKMSEAYHAELESRHLETRTGSDGKAHTYYYKWETEDALLDKIAQLLELQLPDVTIELIGTWVWVSGDTKPHRKVLKALGLRYHGKRVRWYFKASKGRTRYSAKPMQDLRNMYGSRTFENEPARSASAVGFTDA